MSEGVEECLSVSEGVGECLSVSEGVGECHSHSGAHSLPDTPVGENPKP